MCHTVSFLNLTKSLWEAADAFLPLLLPLEMLFQDLITLTVRIAHCWAWIYPLLGHTYLFLCKQLFFIFSLLLTDSSCEFFFHLSLRWAEGKSYILVFWKYCPSILFFCINCFFFSFGVYDQVLFQGFNKQRCLVVPHCCSTLPDIFIVHSEASSPQLNDMLPLYKEVLW